MKKPRGSIPNVGIGARRTAAEETPAPARIRTRNGPAKPAVPFPGKEGHRVITLGIILLVIGLIIKFPILWGLGILALVIGLAFLLAGAVGHAVGGRKHWY